MLLKIIDELLDRSLKKTPDYSKLNRLEDDVWRKIKQSNTIKKQSNIAFPIWSNMQIRYVCLTLALISGILMAKPQQHKQYPQSDILDLKIFSPSAPFLISSNLQVNIKNENNKG